MVLFCFFSPISPGYVELEVFRFLLQILNLSLSPLGFSPYLGHNWFLVHMLGEFPSRVSHLRGDSPAGFNL
jgi:hypothetical protein